MVFTVLIYSFVLILSTGLSFFQRNLRSLKDYRNSYKLIALVPIILISSFKGNLVGTDSHNYFEFFSEIKVSDFTSFLDYLFINLLYVEPLYYFSQWILKYLNADYRVFLIFIYSLIWGFIYYASKNHIKYAEPPKNFNEDWLKPLENSHLGKNISNKFKIVKYKPKKGSMIIADATIIHQSFRKKNAGIRVSLDTGFDLKMKKLKSFKKIRVKKYNVKKIRNSVTISKSDFLNVGKKTYFHFSDSFNQKVFHKGGFKHPTNPKLIRLEK